MRAQMLRLPTERWAHTARAVTALSMLLELQAGPASEDSGVNSIEKEAADHVQLADRRTFNVLPNKDGQWKENWFVDEWSTDVPGRAFLEMEEHTTYLWSFTSPIRQHTPESPITAQCIPLSLSYPACCTTHQDFLRLYLMSHYRFLWVLRKW